MKVLIIISLVMYSTLKCFSSQFEEIVNTRISDTAQHYVKFSKDGKYVFVYGYDKTLRKYDINNNRVDKEWKFPDDTYGMDVNFNNDKAILAINGSGIEILDLMNDTLLWNRQLPFNPNMGTSTYVSINFLNQNDEFSYARDFFLGYDSSPMFFTFDSLGIIDTMQEKKMLNFNSSVTWLESFLSKNNTLFASFWGQLSGGPYPPSKKFLCSEDLSKGYNINIFDWYTNPTNEFPDLSLFLVPKIKDYSLDKNYLIATNDDIRGYYKISIYNMLDNKEVYIKPFATFDRMDDIKFNRKGNNFIYGMSHIAADNSIINGELYLYDYNTNTILDTLLIDYPDLKATDLKLLFDLNFDNHLLAVVDALGYLRIYRSDYITDVNEALYVDSDNGINISKDNILTWGKNYNENPKIIISDIIGNTIEPCSISEDDNYIRVDLSCFQSGVYFCIIKSNNSVKTAKIMITK